MKTKRIFDFRHKLYENTFADAYFVNVIEEDTACLMRVRVMNSKWQRFDNMLPRFEDAARVLQSFHHPHIVSVHGETYINGCFALLTEYTAGVPLSKILERCKEKSISIPLPLILSTISMVSSAMKYAYERVGLVHQNLSPDNLLLHSDGHVSVVHFEGSYSPLHRTYRAGESLGSFVFLAPERLIDDSHAPAIDIYSFGQVLYQMFTLQEPKRKSLHPHNFQLQSQDQHHRWNARLDQENLPSNMRKTLSKLLLTIDFSAEQRPTWEELYQISSQILLQLPAAPVEDFCERYCDVAPQAVEEALFGFQREGENPSSQK